MKQAGDVTPWRANFVGALQLLGRATDRQPLGSPDPVLYGVSAVELYTASLWSDSRLEALTADTRRLTAELFAVGFRWIDRPRHGAPGLWHSELQVGIDLIETRTSLRPAEQSNTLVVAIDLAPEPAGDTEMVSLKVVGIEDLIAEQAKRCLMDGAPARECGMQLQALMELGQDGVAGRLRAGYLARRVASETDGEVVLERSSREQSGTRFSVPRMTTLSRMQMIIDAWRDLQGLSFDQPGSANETDFSGDRNPMNGHHNDRQKRAGQSVSGTKNVVPFCAGLPASPDWR
jgi:hypothetical protein